MRARMLLLVLLLLVPVALAKEVTIPRWQVGDRWSYQISLVENGAPIQQGTRDVVVTARGPFTYQGSAREAVTLTTWTNMTGDPASSFEDVRDAATGALLATRSNGETLTAAAPCPDIEYPIAEGDTWDSECDLGFGPSFTTYVVAGGETLTLPAGTFDALTVDALGMDAVRLWFSQEACGKVAEFSQTNDLQTYVNLTSFSCGPTAPTSASPTPPTRSSPTVTPTGTTTTPPTSSKYDTTCPAGTSHDNGSCLTSDADHDGLVLGVEIDRGTDPNDADTDNDGVRDGDDRAPTVVGTNDNRTTGNATSKTDAPAPGILALLLVLALLARSRKGP